VTLSPYGIREWLTASVLAAIVLVVSGFLGWWWIGMLVLVPWLAVAWFQRGAGISTQDQRAVQARLLQLAGWDVASGEVDLKTLPPAP